MRHFARFGTFCPVRSASLTGFACFFASVLVQPKATAQTMMRMLRKMSGTVHTKESVLGSFWACLSFYIGKDSVVYSLRINVRTELIRLIVLALTLAPSCAPPPKEGSFWAALPQPTVFVLLVRLFCCVLRVCGFVGERVGVGLEVTYCVRGSGLLRGLLWRL